MSVLLALLLGCNPIVGEWELRSLSIDGVGFDDSAEGDVVVERDGTGEFDLSLTYFGVSLKSEGDLEIERIDRETWHVLADVDDSSDSLDLECVVDDDELDCEGEDEGDRDWDLEYVRADE